MNNADSSINVSNNEFKLKKVHNVGGKLLIVIDENIANKLGINDTTILEQHIVDSGILMTISRT